GEQLPRHRGTARPAGPARRPDRGAPGDARGADARPVEDEDAAHRPRPPETAGAPGLAAPDHPGKTQHSAPSTQPSAEPPARQTHRRGTQMNAPLQDIPALPSDQDTSGRTLGDEELVLLEEAIRSGTLTSTKGRFVKTLEERFAERLGVPFAYA